MLKKSFNIKEVQGGITAPKGFLAYGVRAGIRDGKANKDMALIFSKCEAVCAGVFTKNKVQAAPVVWDKKIAAKIKNVRAIVVNSGNANACTGDEGYNNVIKTAGVTAELMGVEREEVLVASTGVIGSQLPMDVIEKGVRELAGKLKDTPEGGILAAEAIMTTDTFPKQIAVELEIGGKIAVIGGMCKGSGMIHPNMGTMLSFITTDVSISKELLVSALKNDVDFTYNMVSVDGDTSTNDTVLLLANGMAGNETIALENEDYEKFCRALNYVNKYLAKNIARDGEGATKLLEVTVSGARSLNDARLLSKAVVTSSLTKAALFGSDANWGRILCALGYSGGEFEPQNTDIKVKGAKNALCLVKNGVAANYSEEDATIILKEPEVTLEIDVNDGDFSATAWGCDLSFDYVKINADYRS